MIYKKMRCHQKAMEHGQKTGQWSDTECGPAVEMQRHLTTKLVEISEMHESDNDRLPLFRAQNCEQSFSY